MKFFHLSDLHIGRQLNGWSLKENQERVLAQITEYAGVTADAILICGDVYDKSIPSGEAFSMFGHFWSRSAKRGFRLLLLQAIMTARSGWGLQGRFWKRAGFFCRHFRRLKKESI